MQKEDKLIIGGHEFHSRFILGSGKYSLKLIEAAVKDAGAEIITLAVRRANTKDQENILDFIPKNVTLLPNTSGARNADEAVRIARLGREMGCGMMVAGGREYLFPITEIVSKKDFFDYQAKYTEGYSDEITPADIAPEIAEELHRMTRIAYRACRCSGVVRVDFIVTPEGKPYLIEINSIPGMSAGSIVPKQARAMGMSLGEMFDLIIADTCRK